MFLTSHISYLSRRIGTQFIVAYSVIKDSRKLIGLLAKETGINPLELPPILVRLAKKELGESDFERLAMKLAVGELKRLIEQEKAER